MNRSPICYQVNLQQGFGGGEVYTTFFTRALLELGWQVHLFVSPANQHWSKRLPAGVECTPIDDIWQLPSALPTAATTVFFHTPQPEELLNALHLRHHRLVVFAHMPLYGRNPAPFREFNQIVAVSRHVIASLQAAGLHQFYPQPLLGVAELDRNIPTTQKIVQGHLYDWDRRKVRERLARRIAPLIAPFLPRRSFARRPGLTLGIVSRLTPIKQFPLLFTYLAPLLAKQPDVHLEIFGDGGYASIRDLRKALQPMQGHYRLWGYQNDVRPAYQQLDALLTGLPEKEALGLNVIEAQFCDLPVLAVDAPPFDETVADGVTGWRYQDPRIDGGSDFLRVLALLRKGLQTNPESKEAHLAQFSFPSFVDRVGLLMKYLEHKLADNP